MTVLVTGAAGQLGRAVIDEAQRRRNRVVGLGHRELTVEDRDAVHGCLARHRPQLVVHCAAWTDVDGCEGDCARAARVNALGTANVVEACVEVGAALVYLSTDFVFDGRQRRPYREDDHPRPLSVYGRTKLEGERAVLAAERPRFYVVRASWVFGPGGENFPRAILERARRGQPLRVVGDQEGRPTMTRDLAAAMLDLAAAAPPSGIYHAANEGSCSWHAFAAEILARTGFAHVAVERISSAELGRPAPRPTYSVLDCERLTQVRGRSLPSYADALARYLAEECA